MDDLIKLATGGVSSTSAMGDGVTEGTASPEFHPDFSAIHGGQEGKIIDRTFRAA